MISVTDFFSVTVKFNGEYFSYKTVAVTITTFFNLLQSQTCKFNFSVSKKIDAVDLITQI